MSVARSADARDRGRLKFAELRPELWDDLVDLFGLDRGASGGCWCMWWRLSSSEYEALERSERRAALKAIVDKGPPPGLLAYRDDQAIGWCAVGPRETLPKLARSRISRPFSNSSGVWFINCFYVRSGFRSGGLMSGLLDAAIAMARKRDAKIIEACPIEPNRKLQWGEGFVGIASIFAGAGFEEVARRSPTRPLMRLDLRPD